MMFRRQCWCKAFSLFLIFLQGSTWAATFSIDAPSPLLVRRRGGGGGGGNDKPSSNSITSTLDELEDLVQDAIANSRKIVVVTGGVLSGIGKGVTASSIGVLFRAMGLRVVSITIILLHVFERLHVSRH